MTELSRNVRLVLVDDHPIFLAGMASLVSDTPGLDLTGQAMTGTAAYRVIKETCPDVAVIDIALPEITGTMLAAKLSTESSSVKLIILTAHEERAYIQQSIDAGVKGYVLKRSAAENLIHAIRAVVSGGFYLDPVLAGRFLSPSVRRVRDLGMNCGTPVQSSLTTREAEVLKFIALGYTNKEIAAMISVTMKSIETYKSRACEKLHLHARTQIVRYAAIQGWLNLA